MKRLGFTIIELLVVVTVIIILLSLLTVGWESAYTYAMRVKCQHHLEQIWDACVMYSTGQGNRLPQVWNWGSANSKAWYDTLVQTGCLSDNRVTVCPSSNVPTGTGSGGVTAPTSSASLDAINKALNWLNDPANQTVVDSTHIYWPGASDANKPGTVGLGLLAFLGAGHDINSTQKASDCPGDPNFGDTIRKALNYLVSRQNASGRFNPGGAYEGYVQGIATMALCDALKMMGPDVTFEGKRLGDVAALAANALVALQCDHGGFPYGYGNWIDNSANIWGLQGIWSAYMAGLIDITQEPELSRLNSFFSLTDGCTNDLELGVGGAGYHYGHPGFGSFSANGDPYGRSLSPWRLTAATLASRLLLGRTSTDQGVQNSLWWLTSRGYAGYVDPAGGPNYNYFLAPTGFYDIYFVYYMSLCLWKLGGQQWADWSPRVPPSLLTAVTTVSATKHYWRGDSDTVNAPYAGYGGHVYPTALAAMSMEATAGQYLPGSKFYVSSSNSYGYNELLGSDSKKPSGDTIAVMDYMNWSVTSKDGVSLIAPRHGGRMNIIFTDGRCESFLPSEILAGGSIPIGMLTPKAGD